MDLIAYKKKKIDELVSLFNQNVVKLKAILNNQVNSIIRLRLNPVVKQNYINFYISNYNKAMVELRNKLTKDIKLPVWNVVKASESTKKTIGWSS